MTHRFRYLAAALALVLAAFSPAFAQGTNGLIEGSVVDQQGLPLPGVVVTATHTSTGFSRSASTDNAGKYRIAGLVVGVYEVKATLSGFNAQSHRASVNVESTTAVPFRMAVAGQTENVEVTAEAPLIDAKDPGVGEVITNVQIESLPLNGRQFGNLAALVPGVSLGYHTDPTKSTQFAPQVGGGGGRNINYLIDGGDNNDDTVGGLVQNFPLDSIGEFKFETQRFRADTGRANGGTIKVVTKSGTNEFRGSVFEYFRDKSLNSQTETEKLNNQPKGNYRKNQFGGSLGGPIVKDKTHFFVSVERVQQDTTQSVSTKGLFPDKDGVFNVPFRENLAVAKINHQFNSNNYLSVRYGYNKNEQPYGAGPNTPPEGWGTSTNKFHSANVNINSALSGGRLNEFVYQFSYFKNFISANSSLPYETFPNGVTVGQSINTPQTTEQHKHQFRDDFSWTMGKHDLRVGASFIYEPTLDITFSTGQVYQYTHLSDSRTSPISNISRSGAIGGEGGSVGRIPNNQYAIYFQDGWRVNERLTIDAGVRYDLVTGFAFDQSKNIIFSELTAAAKAGVFKSSGLPCPCDIFQDFGKEAKEDTNNIAPRAGFTYDHKGDGTLVFRGGLGRYYDFAYTNANILFAVIGAQSSFGTVYQVQNSAGIRNADGSLYQVGQPVPANQLAGATAPLPSHAATPLVKQPFTDQANFGISKALGKSYALEIDGVYAHAQDLGTRVAANVRINGGARRFAGILPQSGAASWRVDVMEGESYYKAINVAFKKRTTGNLSFTAWYSLSSAKSNASLRATDEFGEFNSLNAFDPFNEQQMAYTRTDARHRVTINGTWNAPGGFRLSPVFRYKSKTPYNVVAGTDLNRDGTNFDLPPGVTTLNSARGADFKQFDLRLSRYITIKKDKRIELIAEGFNVTNAKNPGGFVGSKAASNFGQPTSYAGDFQRGEQRLFQLGARFEF
ncbi:MAG: TonB-dependent receptor [Vicinamibacteria bacterium]|nr:TonB-dependent receptor [Vicinamibacteria bacterium]